MSAADDKLTARMAVRVREEGLRIGTRLGDPAWTATDVDAYNSKLMVSTAAGAELGDIHLSGMIELVREIASGKIR